MRWAADSTYIAKSPTGLVGTRRIQPTRRARASTTTRRAVTWCYRRWDALAGSKPATRRVPSDWKACWLGALWAGILATHCSLIFYYGWLLGTVLYSRVRWP